MEHEIRFYFPSDEKESLDNELQKIEGLNRSLRTYEKTTQFNHSDPNYNFYSKEIDGRFRIRISKNDFGTTCKLSWKQRVPDFNKDAVNKEIEKEVHINSNEVDDFLYIVQNVMHFNVVESYERYRTTYSNDEVEIALDEYPFGIALEIENKSELLNPEEIVLKYVKVLELDASKSFKLSWDDKYAELCKEQGFERYSVVTFDKPMPGVRSTSE